MDNATANRVELSQCTGFSVGTNAYPGAISPGTPPPGWEREPTEPISFVAMVGYECNRIHVGPYERGPLHILWDAHGNATIPASCQLNETGPTMAAVLGTLLIDDAELASYLQSRYGIPTMVAEFSLESTPAGPLTMRTWSWGPTGSPHSQFTFPDDGTAIQDVFMDRLFWPHGQGVGQLDLTYDRQDSAYTNRVGYGPMEPPMLMSETAQKSFAGPTSYYSSAAGTGVVTLFSDNQCKGVEPI